MSNETLSDFRYQQARRCKRGRDVPNEGVYNWTLRVLVDPPVKKRLIGCKFDNPKPAVTEPNLPLFSTRSRCFARWQSLGSLVERSRFGGHALNLQPSRPPLGLPKRSRS